MISSACTRSKPVIPLILKFFHVPIQDAYSCQMHLCEASQGLPQCESWSSHNLLPPIHTWFVWASSLLLPMSHFSPVTFYSWALLFSDNPPPVLSYIQLALHIYRFCTRRYRGATVIQSTILITYLHSLLCFSKCSCHQSLPIILYGRC